MNDPIRNEAEAHELRREIVFRSAPEAETNEGTNTPINDPDRILSIVVLVLACLGLAILAHVVV
jgi:hypothetical protein